MTTTRDTAPNAQAFNFGTTPCMCVPENRPEGTCATCTYGNITFLMRQALKTLKAYFDANSKIRAGL